MGANFGFSAAEPLAKCLISLSGWVAEWFKAPVLKAVSVHYSPYLPIPYAPQNNGDSARRGHRLCPVITSYLCMSGANSVPTPGRYAAPAISSCSRAGRRHLAKSLARRRLEPGSDQVRRSVDLLHVQPASGEQIVKRGRDLARRQWR